MWFAIGLFSAISCIIYFFEKKLKTPWEGVNAVCDGITYEYEVINSNQRIKGIKLGVKYTGKFDFSIKLEKWYDRIFKLLGLSVEFQLGKQEFDKKYYLVSDNTLLFESIAAADDLHNIIDSVFDSPKYCARTQKLRCNSKRLWLEYQCDDNFSEDDIREIATVIVPPLKKIADHLELETIEGRAGFDRGVLPAAIIRGISIGLLANGLFHFLRIGFGSFPLTLDTHKLIVDGILVTAAIIGLLIFCTIYFLGKTSRAHLILAETIFIGGIGAFLTTTEELRDLNVEMDRQIAQEITVQIQSKTIESHRGRRGRRYNSYYLHMDDWLSSGNEKKINVSISFYKQVHEGDYIVVFQKPGRLGYRWVEKISKAKKPD